MRMVSVWLMGMAMGGALVATATQGPELMADPATREAVAAVKRGIVEGHRTRDRAAPDSLYAPSYTATDARGGIRTKADLLAALPTDPPMVEGHYELTRVRRWGAIAVASGHGRMVYRNPDGSTRLSEYDSVNVFEERDGRWWYVAVFLP
jgi:hypothetical protein